MFTLVWEAEASWKPSPAQGHSGGENETRDLVARSHISEVSAEPWHTPDTIFKHFFLLLCDYCVTKCTCTFQSIKLNSSSHLCHSSFSSFLPKTFWNRARVTDKKTFPILFGVCVLAAEPPVCVGGVSASADLSWENHTAATVSVGIYWLVTKPHVSVGCRRSLCCLPPGASRCSSVKPHLHSLVSFYNVPSGRPRIFCVIRRKKDVSGKLKVNTDPVDVT